LNFLNLIEIEIEIMVYPGVFAQRNHF